MVTEDEFDFKLFKQRDLSIVSEEDHSNNDCFMCVVMTHGEKDGFLLAYDKKYQSKDLWEYFVGSNCRTLIGKPKLFFIQVS